MKLRENLGNLMFNQENSEGKGEIFQKLRVNQGGFYVPYCLFPRDVFLRTRSHIQLSVRTPKFYSFAYHSVLYSPYEAQLYVL